jgi:hypothetical protein
MLGPAREVRVEPARASLGAPGLAAPERALPRLVYDTPAGWTELAPTAMRAANFRARDPRVECALTLLAGEAGGLAANVQRWRSQLGLPPLDPAGLAALPRVEFFGGEAAFFDASGTYTGMGEAAPRADHRIAGYLRIHAAGSAFLKLVGPADVVAGELDALRALAASFRSRVAAEPAPQGAAVTTPSPALNWRLPRGWVLGPPRAGRLATFAPLAAPELECTLVQLAGEAGGDRANIDRWRGQLGLAPLAPGELEALERLPMLGTHGLYVECADAAGERQLLGALVCDAAGSVFVKLVGPRERVLAERDAFRELCAALSWKR